MKKSFSLLIAVFAVFAMTAVSFAANTATLNITSEPIRQFAPCDKAGGIVGSFDVGTTFRGGDQMTFDLDFGVLLCKDIDFEAGFRPTAGLDHVLPIGYGVLAYDLPDIGVTQPPPSADALAPFHGTPFCFIQNPSTTEGIFFHVHGKDNTARVTIDVLTYDGTVFGADPTIEATVATTADPDTAKMTFAFLDQAVYDPSAHTGLFVPDAAGDYQIVADKADNTLCINVSAMPASITTFDGNFDSKGDKYTWLPSDPQIAHVVESNSYIFQECKGRNLGRTICETAAGQFTDAECAAIDNETAAGFCTNYPNDLHNANKLIIRTANGSPFEAVNYNIQLDILVDGVLGELGAYWSSNAIYTEGFTTATAACDGTASFMLDTADYVYKDADGDVIGAGTDTDCYITPSQRAVTVIAGGDSGSTLGLMASDDYLYIDMPAILQDDSLAGALSVRVTLSKAPCGTIFTDTWDISEAACCQPDAQSGSGIYPYFAKSTGNFMNILIVDNVGDTDGTFQVMFYEEDGDVFQSNETALAAGMMFVSALVDIPVTPQKTAGGGTWGDAKCFAKLSATFAVDGSAWIANATTGESFGYIIRLLGLSN